MLVNGAIAMATDGPSAASSKRTGWIASLFGSKPSSFSNSSQESEDMSETDGAKKDEPAKKEEHITVPGKGTCVLYLSEITKHSVVQINLSKQFRVKYR